MSEIKSPNDMPTALYNDGNWLRNAMINLDGFDCVDFHYERDIHLGNYTGDSCGTWEVSIDTKGHHITAKDSDFLKAFWFAYTNADEAYVDVYEARKATRAAILDKLTSEERRTLGL